MVVVYWTELALEDLKSIHDYISKDSRVYADRMVEKIIARVDQIAVPGIAKLMSAAKRHVQFDKPIE